MLSDLDTPLHQRLNKSNTTDTSDRLNFNWGDACIFYHFSKLRWCTWLKSLEDAFAKLHLSCCSLALSHSYILNSSGFSIKAVQFKDCILNIKEIGGSDKVRPFWYHYFRDAQAIIFVVDSSGSQTDMEQVHEELEKALNDKALRGLPLLVIASCQDKPDARSLQEVSRLLHRPVAPFPAWISNYTHYKVWDEITYPFLNFNGATVEV